MAKRHRHNHSHDTSHDFPPFTRPWGIPEWHDGPEPSSTLNTPKGPMAPDTPGIQEGISSREGFDADNWGPDYDYTLNRLTGNYTSHVVDDLPDSPTVKSKGKSFYV